MFESAWKLDGKWTSLTHICVTSKRESLNVHSLDIHSAHMPRCHFQLPDTHHLLDLPEDSGQPTEE
jgi:hypothetical protein